MYHKNKSLCFYVSQVSLKSFLGSERGRKRAFLTTSEGQVGRDGLAVVEGALAQHLVVSDLVVHLAEGDVVVGQRTETAGVHGNEGLVHRFCL